MNKPLVSVVMITYNHNQFIRKAIESILFQECEFEVELIIADDCSPDDTKEIVDSFKNHPNFGWIRYTKHKVNKGVMANFIWAINQTTGQYCAFCEGDDFWIDKSKLAKQVKFLENNTHYSMCCGNVVYFNVNNNSSRIRHLCSVYDTLSLYDILTFGFSHTSTILVNKKFLILPSNFDSLRIADRPLYFILASQGPIKYFPDIYSQYNIHNGGIFSPNTKKWKIETEISVYLFFKKYFKNDKKAIKSINWGLSNSYFDLVQLNVECKQYIAFFKNVFISLFYFLVGENCSQYRGKYPRIKWFKKYLYLVYSPLIET